LPRDAGRDYQAYLLKLWQVETADGPAWRASLEEIGDGQRKRFADIEALLQHLRDEVLRTDSTEKEAEGG
jgi:hypothetical protein